MTSTEEDEGHASGCVHRKISSQSSFFGKTSSGAGVLGNVDRSKREETGQLMATICERILLNWKSLVLLLGPV